MFNLISGDRRVLALQGVSAIAFAIMAIAWPCVGLTAFVVWCAGAWSLQGGRASAHRRPTLAG